MTPIMLLEIAWLFLLALPVASVAWTVTQEEIFREPREYCARRSRESSHILTRKFFYLFTCEYCLSHWVTLFFLALTGYQLLLEDWRGYLLAFFAVVWIANVYMSLFALLRQSLKHEKIEAKLDEHELETRVENGD